MSFTGQLGSNRGQIAKKCLTMLMACGLFLPHPKNALVRRIPDKRIKIYSIAVVKGHIEVIRGQPEVKLLRNVLHVWLLNLVGRTSDQSVYALLGSTVMQLSTRGQIAYNCPMATKFGRKNS